jgi:hypothetical protein
MVFIFRHYVAFGGNLQRKTPASHKYSAGAIVSDLASVYFQKCKRRESATVAFSGVRIGSGAWSFGYAG